MITIAIADDHTLLRKALVSLINDFDNCTVVIEAGNGLELLEKLQQLPLPPQVAILDIHMPGMNGYATAEALAKSFPAIQTLALSMLNDEASVLKMLHAGVKGYLLKECDPIELQSGIAHAARGEYFINDLMNLQLGKSMNRFKTPETVVTLSEREKDFLRWAATDLTYKEIADKMFISPRTVDSYRDALFEKLQIKSRVGLAIYAIKHRYISI